MYKAKKFAAATHAFVLFVYFVGVAWLITTFDLGDLMVTWLYTTNQTE